MLLKRFFLFVFIECCFIYALYAQQVKYDFSDNAVMNRLKKDQSVLAADSFMGREAGTEGEIMARNYIAKQFSVMGMKPYFGDTSYFQPFTCYGAADFGYGNELTINNVTCKPFTEFYPLSVSANAFASGELIRTGYGIYAPDKGVDDYKNLSNLEGKIFVIEISSPDSIKNDSTFYYYTGIRIRVKTAIQKGAKGVIFINSDKNFKNPPRRLHLISDTAGIPVLFVTGKAYKLINENAKCEVRMKASINRKATYTAYNVAGYINNKAATTVVVGGHYDHLGMGEEGSRYLGPPAIHNGADDNASGTVAMLEVARYFLTSDKKNNNYIFIGFSAEEKGLIGSYNFISSDAFQKANVNYMINLDMIGRLRENLVLFGTGTSPSWKRAINKANGKQLKVKQLKSGFGGSDHQSFIDKGIPAIFVFTCLHPDYHTPADKINKINFEGETKIVKFTERLIEMLDSKGNLRFTQPSFFQMLQGIKYFL